MNKQTDFINACSNGNLKIVKNLLKDEFVDPTANNNFAIQIASCYKHQNIVIELLKDERIKKFFNEYEIFELLN